MPRTTKKKVSHGKTIAGIIVTIAIVIAGVIFINGDNLRSSVINTVNNSTYQAVHLDTDETYFGKITDANDNYITIIDVFYFLDNSKKTLVKRSNESLTLNQEHVISTENLEEGGAILRAILKYKSNKN